MGPLREYVAALVTHIDGRGRWDAAVLTGLGLAAAWALALQSGSLTAVSRHWFYVPVVFAAVRFGIPGSVTTGTLAALLGGPAVFTAPAAATAWTVWLPRGGFFLAVGMFVAALVTVVRDSQRQALTLAQREKHLADQRTALIQTISHEFRTPLTILHGGIQTLHARRDDVAPRVQPLIDSLLRAEQRLDEMVSVVLTTADALDASNKPKPEPVDLTRLIGDVATSLHALNGPDRVSTQIPPDTSVVVTVPSYLQIALRCIIENALKFSPPDRNVHITTTHRNDRIRIVIRDHGPGIDPGFLEDAFRPFTQADHTSTRTHGGLGIGLFTARSITSRLNGSIRIDQTSPRHGTTIVIELPQRRHTDRHGQPRTP